MSRVKLELLLRNSLVYLPFTIFIIAVSIILNKTLECIIFIISYTLFRHSFKIELHMNTTAKCIQISLVTFVISILIVVPKNISIIFASCFGLVVNYILSTFFVTTTKITRGINKDILLGKCNKYGLNELETNILILFYSKRMKIQDIADKYNYSIERINQIKKKALGKIT